MKRTLFLLMLGNCSFGLIVGCLFLKDMSMLESVLSGLITGILQSILCDLFIIKYGKDGEKL